MLESVAGIMGLFFLGVSVVYFGVMLVWFLGWLFSEVVLHPLLHIYAWRRRDTCGFCSDTF